MNKKVKTSFVLSQKLHEQMKIMCILTHTDMGNFIRISIQEKIENLKKEKKYEDWR